MPKDITYRLATIEDSRKVIEFYHRMIELMAHSSFDAHWKRNVHPTDEYLKQAIQDNQLIIGTRDDISDTYNATDALTTSEPIHHPNTYENLKTNNYSIVCALIMNHEGAPGYAEIPWHKQLSDEKVGIFHLVATDPDYHGQGFAKGLVKKAIEIALSRGFQSIRLDTFPENIGSQKLYKSCGFTELGLHNLHYPELGVKPFAIFEIVL